MASHQKRKATQIKATEGDNKMSKASKRNIPIAIEVLEVQWLAVEDLGVVRENLQVERKILRA